MLSDNETDKHLSHRTVHMADEKRKIKIERREDSGEKRTISISKKDTNKKANVDQSRDETSECSLGSSEQKVAKKMKDHHDSDKTKFERSLDSESCDKKEKGASPKKHSSIVIKDEYDSSRARSDKRRPDEADSLQNVDLKCEKQLQKIFEDRLRGKSRSYESCESEHKPDQEKSVKKDEKERNRLQSVVRYQEKLQSSASPALETSKITLTTVKSEKDEPCKLDRKTSSRSKSKEKVLADHQELKSRRRRSCSESDSSTSQTKRRSGPRNYDLKKDKGRNCCACYCCKCDCHRK